MSLPYFDDPRPGDGRRAPRSWWRSDARTLRLDGLWRFRLNKTADTNDSFSADTFDDGGWDRIRVPSHWVLEGYDTPIYTTKAYPFPIDPPRSPADNPTGDYRYTFDIPEDWVLPGTVLRFQGVDSCGMVWLNGELLGHSKGSRLPFEFEVGHALRPGHNVLAARVHRWSSGSYLEDQDMWWLPGIFREVELLERPQGVIDDYFVHADFDHATGSGRLRVDSNILGLVSLPGLNVEMYTGEEVIVTSVQPWSAEEPHLYHGTLVAGGETIDLAVGFRTVTIEGGRLFINGAPVLLRGVNRHEHDSNRGRTLDVETMRKDILMMKQNNINAVRTSHYPPHPVFLQLCDEYGLWVVEECDIETHGFFFTDWASNPIDDPTWRAAVLDRIERMVERDKNRPSVIVWSLGNESGRGQLIADMEEWVRRRDASRPIHYEHDPSYRHSDFYSLMYVSQDALRKIGDRAEDAPAGVLQGTVDDCRRRNLPFMLCEYAHAMGNGPGSLADYQHILETHERFCGAFVWEWIDHGLQRRDEHGNEYFIHGGDIPVQPNGHKFCIDGLVFPDRTPSPGLIEYKKVIEPITITIDAQSHAIRIRNKYDFRSLAHVRFIWRLEGEEGNLVAAGELTVPDIQPRHEISVPMPPLPGHPDDEETCLTVSAILAANESWAPTDHEIAWGQATSNPRTCNDRVDVEHVERPDPAEAPAQSERVGKGHVRLGPAIFDTATGRSIRLGDLNIDGPIIDVWRAPIDNDRGLRGQNDMVSVWKSFGLDRMLHRVDTIEKHGPTGMSVRTKVAPAGRGIALDVEYTWNLIGSRLNLCVTAVPEGNWCASAMGSQAVTLPRLGLRIALPGSIQSVDWFGLGPHETYSDSHTSAKLGRYSSSIDALQTPYVVPQENGNRTGTRRLDLVDRSGIRLRIRGNPTFDFAARRWRSEELEAADHQTALKDSGNVWLNVDYGQRGLGSSSSGPALPERYELPVRTYRFEVSFEVLM